MIRRIALFVASCGLLAAVATDGLAQCRGRGGQGGETQTGTGTSPFITQTPTTLPTPATSISPLQQSAAQLYFAQREELAQIRNQRRQEQREQHVKVYTARREELIARRERRRQELLDEQGAYVPVESRRAAATRVSGE